MVLLREEVRMGEEAMLTVAEVAARLRINPETVRVWLRSGKLKGFRPGGHKIGYRIPESEVRRVLFGGREPEGKAAA
jgi:excisionase family DNA binding protein